MVIAQPKDTKVGNLHPGQPVEITLE
jgi:multidrug resistance efflux pump